MKKKVVIVVAAILVAACGIGVYASGIGNLVVSKFTGLQTSAVNEYAEVLQSEDLERERVISESLISEEAYDSNLNASKFNQLVVAMNATISDPVEYNDLLMRYEYLREVHQLQQTDLDYIADLVISGCNMKDIIDIAYFWLDTNEDIVLIKQIYELKGNYEGSRFWIEEAYDRVTEAKNGALSTEDIQNYFSRGMTAEDIISADKLCRRGVYTISEILEKRCEGQSFLQIINEIEGGGISAVSLFSDSITADDTELDTCNSEELLKAKEISQLAETSEEEVVYSIVSGEYDTNTYAEEYNNKLSEIRERLEAAGVIKSETEVE